MPSRADRRSPQGRRLARAAHRPARRRGRAPVHAGCAHRRRASRLRRAGQLQASQHAVLAAMTAAATLHCGSRTLDLSRPRVMGILNVTPDSFSDGGAVCRPGARHRARARDARGRRRHHRRGWRVDAARRGRRAGGRRARARGAGRRGARARRHARVGRHVQAVGDGRGARRRRADGQRRAGAARARRARRCRPIRRGRLPDAHAGRAAHDAARAGVRATSSPRSRAFLLERAGACVDAGHRARAHRARPGHRLRQDARAQPRADARAAARSPAHGFPVLVGYSRKSSLGRRSPAGLSTSGWPRASARRWRRWRAARRSCASTTCAKPSTR